MFRPQAQAESHSKPGSSLRGSRQYLFFFLFINRLQAQAHSGPGSLLQGSRA